MHDSKNQRPACIAFIGSTGVPNRYGGFEAFLEQCAPEMVNMGLHVVVSCDASLYRSDSTGDYRGVQRIFLNIRANGASSILHDLLAFLTVYHQATHIMVLGVSGGFWFPLFKFMCKQRGKRLGVNIDGIEWQRNKFSFWKRHLIHWFGNMAQRYSDVIVYDNAALLSDVLKDAQTKAVEIPYSGDHVLRANVAVVPGTALTICRIEPENQLDMMIVGALNSDLQHYTIVGNWAHNDYGRSLKRYYQHEPRLSLLDPIYDSQKLAQLRESCCIYMHGHSVGGTNPSLVEMIFYDGVLLCYDVIYNRITAGECAEYFTTSEELTEKINSTLSHDVSKKNTLKREILRQKYNKSKIAEAYVSALMSL